MQVVLIKHNDLVMDEHVQIRESQPLPVEHEEFQHVEFERIYNYLTPSNIKGTYAHVHHYHNVHV